MTPRKPKVARAQVLQWEHGTSLSAAWFLCASEAKFEYRTCEIDSRRMSHRLDMKYEVLEDLMDGKLVAWGYREGAAHNEGPVEIPGHLFPRDGDDTAAVDWDLSTLTSAGYLFARIRITKAQKLPAAAPRKKRPTARKSKQTESLPLATPPPTLAPSESPKKMGRRPVEKPLRAVIRSLVEAGQLEGKSRKEQVATIQTAARAAWPDLFLKETQPSRDKIFSALRAEGLIGPRE